MRVSYESAVITASMAPLSTSISSMSRHCVSRNISWIWSELSGNSLANPDQGGMSRLIGNIDVSGRSAAEQKFGRTGGKLGGI
jgi:hypothetical protein